ncbi:hypothetical protein [Azorhizobium sp. AG788]|uniref:hypothetical protein n=1 Tax=Azorhizobium sp. AG788 TaxID=2183897 RepID=UPI0031387683
MGDYLLAIRRGATQLAHRESQATVQSLALLVASACHAPLDEAHPGEDLSREAVRSRIKRHIDENLGVAALGIESLCRSFGLWRAGLYRRIG